MKKNEIYHTDIDNRQSIAAVVLAAGRSTRFGDSNKLLSDVGGLPMITRVVEAVCVSGMDIVHVVVGHEGQAIRHALHHLDIIIIDNPHYAEGMSTSIAAGIGSLPLAVDAAFVVLGDMPLLSSADFITLGRAYRMAPSLITVPCMDGKRGNPVLWPRQYFQRLLELSADSGGRVLFEELADQLNYVDIKTDAIFIDIDTHTMLDALKEKKI